MRNVDLDFLKEEYHSWLKDYMDPAEAEGLSIQFAFLARRYAKGRMIFGVFIGVALTIMILKYFS